MYDLQMVQPKGQTSSHEMGSFQSYSKSNGFSKSRKNRIDVPSALNMYGDTDLSGAGCGSSAHPVLRRGPEMQFSGSTHPASELRVPTDRK